MLLTHEARLEQNQSVKTMFNVNYSAMNVNHSYMSGNFRRVLLDFQQVLDRWFNVGRGMFHNSYPRGFPTGIGNFKGYGRRQAMQFFRPPVKSNFHPLADIHSDE